MACFAAGTPLLTPDGDKPIEQFKAGDWVLSAPECDPDAPPEPRQVEEVFVNLMPLLKLQVGGRTIHTTSEHPFYVRGKGWTAAKELQAGDRLRSHDGQWVAVESVREGEGLTPVYNLRVAEHHTYFVGGREWEFSVWAHNVCVYNMPGANSALAQEGSQLASRAKDLLLGSGLLDWEIKRTTIAVAKVWVNGKLVEKVVINATAPATAFAKVKQLVPSLEQALGRMHAERYLYLLFGGRANVVAMGVSNFRGPCAALCWNYFTSIGYKSIWWLGWVS